VLEVSLELRRDGAHLLELSVVSMSLFGLYASGAAASSRSDWQA
jgi:hypothetical protein